ncbi:hypothetical protein IM660_02630 [Ruania alkalisoli]|uniref:Uncharacterized protein n=1 Tax=Ruania alkalisoli TaxID=2779775 RepID=A0A7M1SUR2_9MICO|nr:hypothetical protein [Ruania alkalisoli]QOR71221.1 hypothetical protein IM660_02630 [Ruania alkalisoli]
MSEVDQVPGLVTWLLSPERQAAAVLVSMARSTATPLVQVGRLMSELDGVAEVVVIASHEAGGVLRAQFGPARHLYGGAARVIPSRRYIGLLPRLHLPFGSADSARVTDAIVADVRRLRGGAAGMVAAPGSAPSGG